MCVIEYIKHMIVRRMQKMETSIVTFNIRYVYNDIDGINNFIHRAGMIYNKIETEKPDIIGFQEVTEPILKLLERLLADYRIVGHFRNENYTGSGDFIAFKEEKYQLLGCETRWLSPTPFTIDSRFENQSPFARSCVMAMLKNNETGKPLRIFSTHLDHISDEAKISGIKCVFNFIDEMNSRLDIPCILMGDFNSTPGSETIKYCNSRADLRDVTTEISSTCHDFGKREDPFKIDYIYMSNEFADKVTDVSVWDDVSSGIYLSDHYPVCAKLEF